MSASKTYPILLVVGPHRSGTSVLTQILSTLGFDLGRTLMPPSYDNPRGFWENERIVACHDQLLATLGFDWTNATEMPQDWRRSEAAEQTVSDLCDILKDDFNGNDPSLIKDPRLCVLSPIWDDVEKKLKRPVHRVMITREPDHVAASIARRESIPDTESLAIALSYLRRAASLDWPDGAKALSYEALMNWTSEASIKSGLDMLSETSGLRLPEPNSNHCQQILALLRPRDRKSPETDIATQYGKILSGTDTPRIEHLKQFADIALDHPDLKAVIVSMRKGKSLRPPEPATVSIARGEIEALEADLQDTIRERDAFKDGVAERETLLKSLRRKLSAAIKARDAFKDGVEERETLLKSLRGKLSSAIKARDAFKDGVEEREEKLAVIRQDLETTVRERDAFKDGVTEREDTLSRLRATLDDERREKASLEAGVKERDNWINVLRNDLGEMEAERNEVLRLNETQQIKIEMDAARARMVESELSARIDHLAERVGYFEAAPLRRGLKLSVFSVLRTIRQRFPLPEATKLKFARKMTPLALALKPHRDDQPGPVATHAPPPPPDARIDFAFRETDAPVISIIVPVYNEISQTIACLRSIYQQQVSVDYEVIVADDLSPDPFHTTLKDIPGLRYFRNDENLHFLRNCNRNAAHARGDYLVFLNNDTLVKPGWLQALYDSFFEHGDVGIVGSKLIFPDGKLQEAGGIIWEDASGWNWGRGDNPKHPLYNFVRDVDYVSGASFMIPTTIWEELGGFSETLEKAYYEDTDLCFQLRQRGYRVLYQPASEVIHIEGLSSGTDLNAGIKQYQSVNQETFKTRWAQTLTHHWPNATTPLRASDRTRIGHILYIDATTPEAQSDSGSLDAINAMRILQEIGYRVHFVPGSNFAHWGTATRDLQQMGVECLYHPFYSTLDQVIDDRGNMFDYVVLSRPESAERFLEIVKSRLPSAKVIYNTVDLHFMRLERRANEQNDDAVRAEAKTMKAKELDFIRTSDATIVLSETEHSLLSQTLQTPEKLWTIPLIREESQRLVEFDTSRDVAFIGGYRHPPNIDAVEWLIRDIWPVIEASIPDINLHICGSNMPDHFREFATDRIKVRGFVPDLNKLLSGLRLTLAPLRFGAGLKGKVASSIGAGVPCVGTPIAFEGMASEGLGLVKLEARTPQDFVDHIQALYHDQNRWTEVSRAGVDYHNRHYAYTEVMKTYREMLDTIRT